MALIFENWFADFAAIAAVLLTTIYICMQHRFTYWKRKNIHYIKPSFLVGNIQDFVTQKKSIGEAYCDVYFEMEGHKYGGVFEALAPTLIVRDPELIKNVMVKGFENFKDRGFIFDEKNDPLSANLFFLPGSRWRNLRAKLSPTFTSGKMKMMFDTLAKCGEELRLYLNNLGSKSHGIEIKDLLSRYSTDIIASCAFGIETNCLKNPDAEFRVWGRKVFETSTVQYIRDLLLTIFPKFAMLIKVPNTPRDVTKYFMNVLKESIDYREMNYVTRNDFLQLLIQLKNKGYVDPDRLPSVLQDTMKKTHKEKYSKLTFNEVAAQAFVFFVAGFETSATTMTFCLYELSNNLEIQTKLRNEIRNVLKKYDEKVTYDAVQEMEYLDKVVSETLRLHPPVPFLNRVCTKDYTLEDSLTFIEKGIQIVIPINAIQRDPKYYDNPSAFNPENFSAESIATRPSFTYMPFGEGPRICIGQRFGLMQVKVGLISLLWDNEFTLSSKTPMPLQFDKKSFITAPLGGMWLNISKVQ